jgi:hypothetical protein
MPASQHFFFKGKRQPNGHSITKAEAAELVSSLRPCMILQTFFCPMRRRTPCQHTHIRHHVTIILCNTPKGGEKNCARVHKRSGSPESGLETYPPSSPLPCDRVLPNPTFFFSLSRLRRAQKVRLSSTRPLQRSAETLN